MAVGTALVESLTGYVARLAEAHCVSVADLVGIELSAPESQTPLLGPHRDRNRSNLFYGQPYSINGIGEAPKKMGERPGSGYVAARALLSNAIAIRRSTLRILPF
jgi:hypothetical protein